MDLHETQEKIFDFIKNHEGETFGVRQLQGILGLASPGLISHHIGQLEKKGIIVKNLSNNTYRVNENSDSRFFSLPFYGLAKCGLGGRLLDNEPEKFIKFPKDFFPHGIGNLFMVEADGDSMEPDIHAGEYILARANIPPRSGKIIVCTYRGEVLIKKYKKFIDGGCALISLNEEYAPRLIEEDEDMQVAGEVITILPSMK